MDSDFERQISGVAALDDPVRRSLYLYVASRHGDVSRDEAARAARVTRALAGFHLDRLAEEGLLEVSFRRLSGRTGPGAGRPSKLYRRADRQLAVSLPQRSYELAARILAGAVHEGKAPATSAAVTKAARAEGRRIADAASGTGSRAGKKALLAKATTALAANGYEPEVAGSEIRLRNCPFHSLVGEHRELVCGMNLALVEGLVAGLALTGVTPALDPKPGMCCVALRIGKARRR